MQFNRRRLHCLHIGAVLRRGARPPPVRGLFPMHRPPNEIFVSVTWHLGRKFSDYMLVLCQKLHIYTHDIFPVIAPFWDPCTHCRDCPPPTSGAATTAPVSLCLHVICLACFGLCIVALQDGRHSVFSKQFF